MIFVKEQQMRLAQGKLMRLGWMIIFLVLIRQEECQGLQTQPTG